MENILFSIFLITFLILIFILIGFIHQYVYYIDTTIEEFNDKFSYINPLNFKSGDLILVRTVGKNAYIIRTIGSSYYNHVGILYFNGSTPYIFHADYKGVKLIKLLDYLKLGYIECIKLFSIPAVKKYHKRFITAFINSYINTIYRCTNLMLLSTFIQVDLYKLLNVKLPLGLHCLELVIGLYNNLKIYNTDRAYYINNSTFYNKYLKYHTISEKIVVPLDFTTYLNNWRKY